MTNEYTFDWADLAFADKAPLKKLHATFISAPREISAKRFTQLVKEYLPQGNIVLGLAKEQYIDGFEDQPQFRTLQKKTVQTVIDKVNKSKSTNKIYVLSYFQREWHTVVSKLKFERVLMVNGSWKHVFHNSQVFYVLTKEKIPYKLISPFCDENEAREYEGAAIKEIVTKWKKSIELDPKKEYTAQQLLEHANFIAKGSFDYSFQTGVTLGKSVKGKDTYNLLIAAHNTVVPFETYALHNGASREAHFSPPNDLNHYDAVHAETELIVRCAKYGISLKDTALFINLLPCPTCARMLCETDITEIFYQNDHSDGYAVKLLEKAGKTVRRIVI